MSWGEGWEGWGCIQSKRQRWAFKSCCSSVWFHGSRELKAGLQAVSAPNCMQRYVFHDQGFAGVEASTAPSGWQGRERARANRITGTVEYRREGNQIHSSADPSTMLIAQCGPSGYRRSHPTPRAENRGPRLPMVGSKRTARYYPTTEHRKPALAELVCMLFVWPVTELILGFWTHLCLEEVGTCMFIILICRGKFVPAVSILWNTMFIRRNASYHLSMFCKCYK
jgi:hypothetical protein